MTDTNTDRDINDAPASNTRSATSSSTIVTSTTTTRRHMHIETEPRTDTMTTRRMASSLANRSIQQILENTKSPNDGRQQTSYTYAQSSSYAPVTRTANYDIPVMARRNLHESSQADSSSFAPWRILSAVRSQIANGYNSIRNRFVANGEEQDDSRLDLASGGLDNPGTRFSRTSSTSSASSSRGGGYNLRSRPVHSTPRDQDSDQPRKVSSRIRKDNQSDENGDDQQDGAENEDQDGENRKQQNTDQDENSTAFYYLRKVIHLPIDIFGNFWNVVRVLPLWFLLPLLFLFFVYTLPFLACKPFEYYRVPKVNAVCHDVHQQVDRMTRTTYNFVRQHTYERGVRNVNRVLITAKDVKDSVISSLSDLRKSTGRFLSAIGDRFNIGCNFAKGRLIALKDLIISVPKKIYGLFRSGAASVGGYCDSSIEKMKKLLQELKEERSKYLGPRHTLKPEQEKELETIVRQMIEEYAADETGQADYALAANGGQVVATRCTEYTDEPRQNVVKFLGIPIVHMSKQPDIMIKHGRMPGQCFPFKGDQGSVVIRLAVPVVPTEFALEHLSKSISIVGHISSAPKNFTVYALRDKNDKEGTVLGRYVYDAENGPALQRFRPQIDNVPIVEYVEFQVTSNWGNPTYTCIYRFRVHGDMQSIPSPAA